MDDGLMGHHVKPPTVASFYMFLPPMCSKIGDFAGLTMVYHISKTVRLDQLSRGSGMTTLRPCRDT